LGIAIIIATGASFFLRLFGPEFESARLPLLILILSHVINAGAGSVGYLLNMTGHHMVSARVYGITALINIGTNVIGIYLFGITGAAVATVLSMLIWNYWLHVLVSRRLDLSPSILFVMLRN
jgi:O-antigen/teichoic acid export membrane protein